MRAMVVEEPGGELVLRSREVPAPGFQEVLLRVRACGVCHSDVFARAGVHPQSRFPLVLGHEIAGEIAEIGEHVTGWQIGDRVGVGWYGGNCGWCEPCRRGLLMDCSNMSIPGMTQDGGYAEYVVVRATALASLPDDVTDVEAAPMLCAGVTTFQALRVSGTPVGGRVAVVGIGGLGHLAVQFASRLGFETIAIGRGQEKSDLAMRLGATHYIDSTVGDAGAALLALGGADTILATTTQATAMAAVFSGLRPQGKLMVVGASMEPLPIPAAALSVNGDKRIDGHAAGTAVDSEDALRFGARVGVRPIVETLPLEEAASAFAKMESGQARFRMVLDIR